MRLKGVLIEEARTNLWLRSADAGATPRGWSTGNPKTIVANATVSPDGTTTAASVAYPLVSGAGLQSLLAQSFTATVAPYSFSVYLKGAAGGERVYIMATVDAVNYYRTQCILTTAWQRFVVITPALTAAPWYFQIGTDLRDASQTATPAQTVYVWGADVQQGAFPTSHIPTTSAAVTRAADLASMASTPGATGTYAAKFIPIGVAASLPAIVSGNAGSPVMAIGADSRLIASIRSGASVFSGVAPAMTFNAVNKTAFGWLTGASKAAVNGTLLGANAVALTVTGTTIQFGSDGVTPGNNAINGTMQTVQGWPRQLSDAEMQQVTT